VPAQIQHQIKGIFPVPDLQPNTLHVGHLLIFNHKDRNKAYAFIKNKFHAKFTTVKANKLNHVGRLTYIQSVLCAIPVYYMATILFSMSFIAELTIHIWERNKELIRKRTDIGEHFTRDVIQSIVFIFLPLGERVHLTNPVYYY